MFNEKIYKKNDVDTVIYHSRSNDNGGNVSLTIIHDGKEYFTECEYTEFFGETDFFFRKLD